MAGPHLRSLSPAPTFPQPTSRARDGDGDVHRPSSSPTLSSADLDLVGLNTDGMVAILLPVSLVLYHEQMTKRSETWTASMIAIIVIGGLLIPVFLLWDLKTAKYPVIAPRFCFDRSVVLASLIGAFDFVSPFILTRCMNG